MKTALLSLACVCLVAASVTTIVTCPLAWFCTLPLYSIAGKVIGENFVKVNVTDL